jgi:hypothetical protein
LAFSVSTRTDKRGEALQTIVNSFSDLISATVAGGNL